LAWTAIQPLAPILLARRAKRGKEDPARLGERLGRASMARPPGDLVWLHGASVGETLSLLPLVEALDRERPGLSLLVTSGTLTSAALLARRLPQRVIHQFAPLDTPAIARRFLAHWRPALTLFVESELWPTLLLEAKHSGSRLALLGARLSEDSAAGWARAPGAARQVLGAFDLILAQDAIARRRIEALGGRVDGELDLKQSAAPLPYDEGQLAEMKSALGARAVLVAASTHSGEEDIVQGAWARLAVPAPLLILVPRHPDRGEAVAATLKARGLSVARRALGEPLTAQTQVYVADTLGELGLFYRLADMVVMGGSLTGGIGGHNPLEPARLGLPIITGHDVANFRESYAGLAQAEAAVLAGDEDALAACIARLFAHPGERHEMGLRAKAYSERADTVLAQAMRALGPLMPKAAR
jgi:3-deoxy-D-manno-octulosonic-acid transferase